MVELVKVKDQFERAQKQYESVNNDLKLAKGTIAELQIDKSELEEDIKERKIREKDFKHEEASIADLKKRIHLLEELNEIVLGEYSLLEQARNDLIANWRFPGNVQSELLIPSAKSVEFGRRLDQALSRKR